MHSWDLRLRLRGFGFRASGFRVFCFGFGFRVYGGGLSKLRVWRLPEPPPYNFYKLGHAKSRNEYTPCHGAEYPNTALKVQAPHPKPYTLNPKPCRAFETSEDPSTLKPKRFKLRLRGMGSK